MMSNGAVLGLTLLFLTIIGVLVYFLVSKKECNTGEYKNADGSCTACPCMPNDNPVEVVTSCLQNGLNIDKRYSGCFDDLANSFMGIISAVGNIEECIGELALLQCGDGEETIVKILNKFKTAASASLEKIMDDIGNKNEEDINKQLKIINNAAQKAVTSLVDCGLPPSCTNLFTKANEATQQLKAAIDTFTNCLLGTDSNL